MLAIQETTVPNNYTLNLPSVIHPPPPASMHRSVVREHNECGSKISVESAAVTSADAIVMVKSTVFLDL